MFNKKALIVLSVISGLFMATFSACSKKTTEPESIKIGAILPLTGPQAFYGTPELAGLRVAVDELNVSDPGSGIVLIGEDSKGQAKDAVSAAKKLIEVDKVKLGVVSTSGMANAVAPLFAQAGIPLITICSDNTIPVRYPNAVNIYVNVDIEQTMMAQYLLSQGVHKLSVLRMNHQVMEQAIGLLKGKSEGKLQIVNDVTFDPGATDFKAQVNKVVHDDSEAIYLAGMGGEYYPIIKALREMKAKKRLFGLYTFLNDTATKDGVDMFKGVHFTSFANTPDEIAQTAFGKSFASATGKKPGPFMDYIFCYESLKIWHGMIKSGVALNKFPEAARGRTFTTLIGEVKISGDGVAQVPMAVATYDENGAVKIVYGKTGK